MSLEEGETEYLTVPSSVSKFVNIVAQAWHEQLLKGLLAATASTQSTR